MIANENDNPLISILQDVESRLHLMSAAELHIFEQSWQALSAYIGQPDNIEAEMLHKLYKLLTSSPTLEEASLDELVLEASRYTSRPDKAGQANHSDGMAPVRNEVVKAVHQLGSSIRQQAIQSPS